MAEENTNWEYKPSAGGSAMQDAGDSRPSDTPEKLTWTAKEFIEHQRGGGWYAVLILGSIVLAGLFYLLTRDFFAVGATLAACLIMLIYAGHKPNEQSYELTHSSLKIGSKIYKYNFFRSFSVIHEGEHTSINLESIKRYMPPIVIYFPPEYEKQVTNLIGNHLPLEEESQSLTDRITHRLRF